MAEQGPGCSYVWRDETISRTQGQEEELRKSPTLTNAPISLPWLVTEHRFISMWRDLHPLPLLYWFSLSHMHSCDCWCRCSIHNHLSNQAAPGW